MWIYRFVVQYAVDHEAMARAEYKTMYVILLAEDDTTADLLAAQLSYQYGVPCLTERVY